MKQSFYRAVAFILLFSVAFGALIIINNEKVSAETRSWMLDAGHGGEDPGAVYGFRYEKDDNLRMVLAVAKRLERSGEKVYLTRSDDSTVELNSRSDMANRLGVTYFISFHRNSSSNLSANGAEVFYHTSLSPDSPAAEIARRVQSALVSVGYYDRGVKQNNFSVLRRTSMTAVLMEIGFIRNTSDNAIFDSDFEIIADRIASALLSYVGKSLTPETTSPPTTESETTVQTTSPPTTAPQTTVQTTSPPTTAPQTTAPETTKPQTTKPQTTKPETTVPQATVPPPSEIQSTELQTQDTVLQTTQTQTSELQTTELKNTEKTSETASETSSQTESEASEQGSTEFIGTEDNTFSEKKRISRPILILSAVLAVSIGAIIAIFKAKKSPDNKKGQENGNKTDI